MMKQTFTLALLSLTMLCVAGCNEETNTTQAKKSETPANIVKTKETTTPASKRAEGKCGTGKCGTAPKMTP